MSPSSENSFSGGSTNHSATQDPAASGPGWTSPGCGKPPRVTENSRFRFVTWPSMLSRISRPTSSR
eukprot:2335455-Pyramimonas_sp.AAC.1